MVGILVALSLLIGACLGILIVRVLRGSSSPVAVEISRAVGVERMQKARRARAAIDLSRLSGALQGFRIDNDRYPTAEEGLTALRAKPGTAKVWRGPYVTGELPRDPWGNPYVYQWPGPLGDDSFSLLSHGSDHAPGGSGEAEDIAEGDR